MGKRILAGLMFAGLVTALGGCGPEKAEVPTSFTPKPDKPPSAAGGPATPKPGGGGGKTPVPGGGGATAD